MKGSRMTPLPTAVDFALYQILTHLPDRPIFPAEFWSNFCEFVPPDEIARTTRWYYTDLDDRHGLLYDTSGNHVTRVYGTHIDDAAPLLLRYVLRTTPPDGISATAYIWMLLMQRIPPSLAPIARYDTPFQPRIARCDTPQPRT